MHGDAAVAALVPDVVPATEEDWETEYLSLDIAIRVVDDLDEALAHIRRYSTHHTESIITEDAGNAERFLAEVDSAVVMVNASTRFTDGARVRLRRRGGHLDAEAARARADGAHRTHQHQVARARIRAGPPLTA